MMKEVLDEREKNIEINLQELVRAYLKRWWVIVLCVGIAAAITLAVSVFFITPQYRVDISVYVNNNQREDKESVSSSDLSTAIRLVNSYMNITKSDLVLEKVAQKLDGAYTLEELRSVTTTAQVQDTEIFKVYVLYKDPEEATRIANAFADVAPDAIESVIDGTRAEVFDRAKVPQSRYSPSYSRNTILGGAVGLLLALVFLTVSCLKDTRIKDDNDLTEMFDLPILGRIPDFDHAASERYHAYDTKTNE